MRKNLLIDTNLLLLLVVGSASRSYIAKHRRLTEYAVSDYELLEVLSSPYAAIATTPNILSETSNLLAAGVHEPLRGILFARFNDVIEVLEEAYVESRAAARRAEFRRLGLSDCANLQRAGNDCTLLTADSELHLAAAVCGVESLNFNHFR